MSNEYLVMSGKREAPSLPITHNSSLNIRPRHHRRLYPLLRRRPARPDQVRRSQAELHIIRNPPFRLCRHQYRRGRRLHIQGTFRSALNYLQLSRSGTGRDCL